MKRLIYQVYVGKGSGLYDWCTQSVKAYADSIGADYIVQKDAILKIKPDPFTTTRSKESYEKHGGFLPIYEKENAFDYIQFGYDQIAIIDADIYIREGSPNIFDSVGTDVDFGGVIEREMPITTDYTRKIANYSRMQYGMDPLKKYFDWSAAGADFYNMGMMVCNKSMMKYLNGMTAKQFLLQPKFKAFIDGQGAWKWSTDQTLLNYWVKAEGMKVRNISWKWNALYTAVANERIKEAHFVHFFLKDKLPNRGENVEQLKKDIL